MATLMEDIVAPLTPSGTTGGTISAARTWADSLVLTSASLVSRCFYGTNALGSDNEDKSVVLMPIGTSTWLGIWNRRATTPSEVIADIKKRSGMTWHQVARLFGVDRRSVHLWVRGGGISSEHIERAFSLQSLLDRIDAGNPMRNRVELLEELRRSDSEGFNLPSDEERWTGASTKPAEKRRLSKSQRRARQAEISPLDFLEWTNDSIEQGRRRSR
jgi:hypothetical protein